MEKTFEFDLVMGEKNMCNRKAEIELLISVMERRGRIVVHSSYHHRPVPKKIPRNDVALMTVAAGPSLASATATAKDLKGTLT